MPRVASLSVLLGLCVGAVKGDLAGTVQRASRLSDFPVTSSSETELSSSSSAPRVVRLQRVEGRKGAHFYVGTIAIGLPRAQELQVLFDTGSGNVVVPHFSCHTAACQKHKKYVPWASESAVDIINGDGQLVSESQRLQVGAALRDAMTLEFTQADLGEGNSTSVYVKDQVCVGTEFTGKVCSDLSVLAAVDMDKEYFMDMPYDGIVGLGLPGLAAHPSCSFFGNFASGSKGVAPQFGISLGAASGELYLGGHDESKLAAPLQWFPVLHPEDGFWEVSVKSVRLGDVVVDDCSGGCRGVVDTGASRLGVQESKFAHVKAAMASATAVAAGGGCEGPDLHFDLGSMTLTLRPQDYLGHACEPDVGPLALDPAQYKGVYALGEAMLRRYYAAFDWETRRIGFAPVAKRLVRLGSGGKQAGQSETIMVV